MEFIMQMEPYVLWLSLAFLCLIIEILLVPLAGFWLCLAGASLLTGVVAWVTPMSWTNMLLLFSVVANVALLGWWFFLRNRGKRQKKAPELTYSPEKFLGYEGTVMENMKNKQGRMRVYDTAWRIQAEEDYPAGTIVTVTGMEGIVLQVHRKE